MTARPLHTLIRYLRRRAGQPGDAALTDAQLLERWSGRRDQAAFELLLWRHGPMVLGACRRLLRQDGDAEDAFQATFLILLRKAGSIRRREALAAWLHRVACRVALRARAAAVRRACRERPMVDVPANRDTDEAAARDLRAVLDQEIDRLPPRYRQALILCCLEGKSQEEAARLLACPRGTVSSWLTRARRRLRQRLLRRGIGLATAGLSGVLTQDALPAAALAPLVTSTLRITAAIAAGRIASAEIMSSRIVALAERTLRAMFLTRLKIVCTVLLAVALVGAGVGAVSYPTQAADPTAAQAEKGAPVKGERPARPAAPEPADGIAWGRAAHGLQAGIAFRPGDQQSFAAGQSVTFVVYLRNVGDRQVRLTHIETLFAEWMPGVEDADGNRIGVAPGPIPLGVMPIVHRTMEPGQRITLGYPWFRIQPPGWRGEFLGPTGCAGPGRYKVGYAGLPVRLNDGKSDTSLPTGQVELDIRPTEAPGRERPEGEAPKLRIPAVPKEFFKGPDQALAGGRMFFVNRRTLDIPFHVDEKDRSGLRRVILFISEDRGQTYRLWQAVKPAERRFHLSVKRDGEHWLIAATEDAQGRLTPADPTRVPPSLRICVDTTPPVIELMSRRPGTKAMGIAWKVRDENLDLSSLRLEYRLPDEEVWTPLAIKQAATGEHGWDAPGDGEIEVRLRARDKAGNAATAVGAIKPVKRP